jgi:RNA polymerase sigma factor (sigma-70 family)
MANPQPTAPLPNHECVFADRYPLLVKWANLVTGGNEVLAQDLVHDAYMQFVFARPDLPGIQSLDRYLYGMLRNLYVSHLRRATRMPENTLLAVEYDSVEISLKYADERERLRVRDELWQACEYVCARKETSRSGSVMILRFFHGYYPAEIARITGNSRAAVSESLRTARDEIRQYLRSPRLLVCTGSAAVRPIARPGDGVGAYNFQDALRKAVFLSCNGPCIPPEMLRSIYTGRNTEPIHKTILAHVVSCQTCLGIVNLTLNLAPLSARDPMDMTGRDDDDDFADRPPGGGLPPDDLQHTIRRGRREARQVFEHHPRQLYIAVNGRHMASHSLHDGTNEATFRIDCGGGIEFIEILSEQGIRLVFMSMDGAVEHGTKSICQKTDLSDGRSLWACLRLGDPSPLLEVTYRNPASTELRAVESFGEAKPYPESLEGSRIRPLWQLGLQVLRANARVLRWASGLALLVLVAALSVWRFRPQPDPISLLKRAISVELQTYADAALYRTIQIEEKTADGSVLSTSTTEIWQSGKLGRASARVYDSQHHLMAGEWRSPDGVRTIVGLDSGRRATREAFEDRPTSQEVWRFDLSAQAFSRLVHGSNQTDLVTDGDFYVVSYRPSWDTGSGGLVKANLKLARNNLRATEASLLIRDGRQVRQFNFTALITERRDLTGVDPSVFLPAPGPRGTRGHPKTLLKPARADVVDPAFEIAVLYALAQVNADMGENLTVDRLSDGRVKVAGLVEDAQRKAKILQALPATSVTELHTVGEMTQPSRNFADRKAIPILIQRLESANERVPVDEQVRSELHTRGIPETKMDEAVREFSADVVNTSWSTLQHARALQRIASRFTADELAAAPEAAKRQWNSIILRHAATIRSNLISLDMELRSVCLVRTATPASVADIRDVRELKEAAGLLLQVWSAGERTLALAFSIPLNGASDLSIDLPALQRSLSEALTLASRIQATAGRLDGRLSLSRRPY